MKQHCVMLSRPVQLEILAPVQTADNSMPPGLDGTLFLILPKPPVSLYTLTFLSQTSYSFMPLSPSISVRWCYRGWDITHCTFLTCCHQATQRPGCGIGCWCWKCWHNLLWNVRHCPHRTLTVGNYLPLSGVSVRAAQSNWHFEF